MWYSLCLVFGLAVWLGLHFDMLLGCGLGVGCIVCFEFGIWVVLRGI